MSRRPAGSNTPFGVRPDGAAVRVLALQGGGLRAEILTYGATLRDLRREADDRPLVLGASTLAPYLGPLAYAGAIVGRFANRIGGAGFVWGGRRYGLDPNFRGRHTLHGGAGGSHAKLWQVDSLSPDTAVLSLILPDGDQGFPGTLCVRVRYALPGDGTVEIVIEAETDQPTPCSFAPHPYFNLASGGTILDHELRIEAGDLLEVDADLIPTGRRTMVAGTAFDFRTRRRIGGQGDGAGLDHNFCLSPERVPIRPVAELRAPSGLTLTVETTEPGLQVYDGAHLGAHQGGPLSPDPTVYGAYEAASWPLVAHAGIALEPQLWPDSPNRSDFPDSILRPGAIYRHHTRYRLTG